MQLCGCDSGLSTRRCCEFKFDSLGSPEASRQLVPLEERAQSALEAQQWDTAETLVIDVLELAPDRPRALAILYQLRKRQHRATAAVALIRRLVRLEPNNLWALNDAAVLLMSRGNIGEAAVHARNTIRIAPEHAQSHYLMGMVQTEAHHPVVAEYHYRRALELSAKRDPVLLSNFALCLKNQGKVQEARSLYHEALAAAPQSIHILMGLARLEEVDRNLDAALETLDRVEALQADNPHALLLRAVIERRRGDTDRALALLDRLASAQTPLGPEELLEKGRLLDRMGRYDDAFAAFDAGRRLLRERSGRTYLHAEAAQAIARRKAFFNARRMPTLPRAATRYDGAQPLFIVGFPRSGTTLLEQTLSAHPRIVAGDELPIIHEIANLMPRLLDSPLAYPEALVELWMGDHRDDLDNLRDHYLRKAAQLGILTSAAAWFTDKMPLNEMDIGLISLLFPKSPIVHVLRHPLDVVLSVFSNQLTHGYLCALALESAATHYVRVMDLVNHYVAETKPHYLQVRYEDMVRDQERTVRRVFNFIGEEFRPACLAFHENRRYARTASYAQVSEKLYDRSCFRYRHYLKQLDPVIALLQPTIEQLGYQIEAA